MTNTRGRQLFVKWLDGPGRSQSWLARVMKLSQSSISGWYRGATVPEPAHRRAIEIIAGKGPDGQPLVPDTAWLSKDDLASIKRAEAFAASKTGT